MNVRVQRTPDAPRRAGKAGLRAPIVDATTWSAVERDPLGPALEAWWARHRDRDALVTALSLALPHAAPSPRKEIAALIQAIARGAQGPREWTGARRVLRDWPGCAAPLGLPFDGPVAPPRDRTPAEIREARLALGGRRIVDADELALLWSALPDGRWVDLGSGDGATVRALSRPGREVIGVDVAPPAQVVIPASEKPDVLRRAAIEGVGEPVDVVVIAYPSHGELVDAGARRVKVALLQLETALELLKPGGVAVLVTESPGTLRATLPIADDPRVAAADRTVGPIGEAALRDLGIVPYTPRVNELVGAGQDRRPLRPFGWGFVSLTWAARSAV